MQQEQRARHATAVFFFNTGAVVGVWVPFIPERAHALGLNPAQLGTTLLGSGIGAVLAMPLAGALVPRLGSRLVSVVAGVGFPLFLLTAVLAPTRPLLLATLVLYGMCGAATDIAMNAQAVLIEKRSGKRIISSLHGTYSLGNVVGSLAVSAALAHHGSPTLLVAALATALAVAVLAAGPAMLPKDGTPTPAAQRSFAPRLVLLGTLVVAAMVSEGAIADWSASLLRAVRGFGPGAAGIGFAVFAAAMLTGRFLGDRIVARLRERWTLRLGGLGSALGALLVLLGPGKAGAMAGFALMGFGLSNVCPVLYRSAGQVRGVPAGIGLATAVGMGYAGLLAGPPLLGYVGQGFGLPAIFLVLVALSALLSATANVSSPA